MRRGGCGTMRTQDWTGDRRSVTCVDFCVFVSHFA